MPRNTLTWKKKYGNLTAARHAPSKKVQITRYYVIWMCAFLSVKKNYGKIGPRPARRSCLLAHDEPFFHFHNSVDDHIFGYVNMYTYIYIYTLRVIHAHPSGSFRRIASRVSRPIS